MEITSSQHIYGWYNDKRIMTEYDVIKNEKSNTVYHSQRWFYPVHLYNNQAKIEDNYILGKNIDVRV